MSGDGDGTHDADDDMVRALRRLLFVTSDFGLETLEKLDADDLTDLANTVARDGGVGDGYEEAVVAADINADKARGLSNEVEALDAGDDAAPRT